MINQETNDINPNSEKSVVSSWNVLRFLMILIIVIYHSKGLFVSNRGPFIELLKIWGGEIGNIFFFTISGLLINNKYKKKLMDGMESIIDYLFCRIKKFYCLYLLSEILCLICLIILKKEQLSFAHLVSDSLLITNGWVMQGNPVPYNFPAWFLCVLVLCYLLYYLICKISKKDNDIFLCLIIFMIFWGYYLRNNELQIPFLYRTSGEGYWSFFTGVCLGELWNNYFAKHEKLLNIIVLCTFILFLLVIKVFGIKSDDYPLIIMLLVIYLIYIFRMLDGLTILNISFVKTISSCSMEIFLFHIPFYYFYLLLFGEDLGGNILFEYIYMLIDIIMHSDSFYKYMYI